MTIIKAEKVSGPTFGPVAGAASWKLSLSEAGVNDLETIVWEMQPDRGTTEQGTVMLFSGTDGTDLYTLDADGLTLARSMTAAGWRVLDFEWGSGWFFAGTSFKTLAQRTTEIARWAYDVIHGGDANRKPFNAVGNSGGASAIAYGLTTYDMGSWLSKAILGSGPAFSRLDFACTPEQSDWSARSTYLLSLVTMEGAVTRLHPTPGVVCDVLSGDQVSRREQSVLHAAAVLSYPKTRVWTIIGRADTTAAVLHALEFYTRVTSTKTLVECAATPHFIPDTAAGRTAILNALAA